MQHAKTMRVIGAIVVSVAAVACASNEVQPQRQAMVRAQASIQEAEQSGAYEHGGAELESARDKLAQARLAAEDGDAERAERLATEARLDAELASAIASNQDMQAAANELEATIRTLREELQSSQGSN